MDAMPDTTAAPSSPHRRQVTATGEPDRVACRRVPPGMATWTRASLRVARHDDLPAIRALQADAWRRLARPFYSSDQIEAFIRRGTMDPALIDAGRYYLLESHEALLACAGWQRLDGEGPHAPTALVRAVYVHPDRARSGLGSRMMRQVHAMARLAGCRTLRLTATLTGVPLYTKLGYAATERVHWPLPGGLSLAALVMTLQPGHGMAARRAPSGGPVGI